MPIANPAVSGSIVVWSHAGGLVARTITFPDPAPSIVVRSDLRYFPDTGYVIGYAFLNFWNANGGATIFGFPLTNEVLDPASQLSVQYFERARFEYHPEAAGSPQVVQLTNVGRIITAGRTDPRYDNNSAFPPQPLVPAGSDRSYYVQTQHSIGGQFKQFFDQNGGTFVFGYPISEETIEANPTDGVAYTVQWFERARFEFHPEFNGTPNAIELGQLGRQLLLGQVERLQAAMLAALHPETAPPRVSLKRRFEPRGHRGHERRRRRRRRSFSLLSPLRVLRAFVVKSSPPRCGTLRGTVASGGAQGGDERC